VDPDGRHSQAGGYVFWPAIVSDEERASYQNRRQIEQIQFSDQTPHLLAMFQMIGNGGSNRYIFQSADHNDVHVRSFNKKVDQLAKIPDGPLPHLVAHTWMYAHDAPAKHLAQPIIWQIRRGVRLVGDDDPTWLTGRGDRVD
jgi:hypothetical protein